MSFLDGMMTTLFGGGDESAVNNSGGLNVGNGMNISNGINANLGLNEGGNFGVNSGFSQGSSGGSSSGFNQSSQSIWGPQAGYLKDVYGQAQDAFTDAQGQIQGLQPQVQDQIAQTYQQAQGGMGNQMGGGFSAGLQGQVGPNAYVNAIAGDMMSDAAKIKQQNLGALDARAAAAGMSGSSGYRDQVNSMNDSVDEQTMQGLNQLRFNAQNQGIQNQMNLANMMDRNQQFGVGNTGAMQQAALNQFNPAMMGQQSAALYANTIGGPTTLTSSSGQTSSSQGSSNMSNNLGMSSGFSNGMNLGLGMNQGMGFNNNYGSNVGSGASNGSTTKGIVPGLAAAKTAGF